MAATVTKRAWSIGLVALAVALVTGALLPGRAAAFSVPGFNANYSPRWDVYQYSRGGYYWADGGSDTFDGAGYPSIQIGSNSAYVPINTSFGAGESAWQVTLSGTTVSVRHQRLGNAYVWFVEHVSGPVQAVRFSMYGNLGSDSSTRATIRTVQVRGTNVRYGQSDDHYYDSYSGGDPEVWYAFVPRDPAEVGKPSYSWSRDNFSHSSGWVTPPLMAVIAWGRVHHSNFGNWMRDTSIALGLMGEPPFAPTITLEQDSSVPRWQQRITWAAAHNPPETTYELWRRTFENGAQLEDQRIYSGNGTAFVTTDQKGSQYYLYRVRALYDGKEKWSDEVPYHTAPTPVVSTGEARALQLSWVPPAGELSYRIHLRRGGDTWTQQGTSTPGAVDHSVEDLDPNSTYEVALDPVLTSGGTNWWAEAGGSYSPLWEQPGSLSFTAVEQTAVTVTWSNGSLPASGVTYRLFRDGGLVYEGTDRQYSDDSLAAATRYTYSVCAVNAQAVCGPSASKSITTAPLKPTGLTHQHGSFGWGPDARGWAELKWNAVENATGYKVHVSGAGSSTVDVGNQTRHRFTDLVGGGSYQFTVSAYTTGGESPRSDAVSLTIPDRRDNAAPAATVDINDGALTTSGSRVRVRVDGADETSGPQWVELSNDGTTWSAPALMQNAEAANLVTVAGGNPVFTDLAGWYPDSGVWATITGDEGAEQGGQVARLEWEAGTATRSAGLRLDMRLPVSGGKMYTLAIRYRTENVLQGSVGLWSQWRNGSDHPVGSADHSLPASETWQVRTFTLAAPADAARRDLALGMDQANDGATLLVDWIVVNEGLAAVGPPGDALRTASISVPWELASAAGTATVYARVTDLAGNVSATASDTIQVQSLVDTSAPRVSLRINGGAETTTSQDVNLEIHVQDDQTPQHLLRMRFSNDGIYWSAWEPYAPVRAWQLSPGTQKKTVSVQVQDAGGNIGSDTQQIYYLLSAEPVVDPGVFWAEGGDPGRFVFGSDSYEVYYLRVAEFRVRWDTSSVAGIRQVRYGFDPNLAGSRWESISPTRGFALPPWDGVKTLYAQTDDGRIWMQRFVLDTVAPELRAGWQGDATVTASGGRAVLTILARDNLVRPEDLLVSVNNGPWTAYQVTVPLQLSGNGIQTVTVQVKDPAGNTAATALDIYVLP